jgi:predicted metal-binding protein
MTPEERLSKIVASADKQNEAIRGLIAVGRTCLDSIQELREVQREDHKQLVGEIREMREAQSTTDEKLNILIDTVDRIIGRGNKQ